MEKAAATGPPGESETSMTYDVGTAPVEGATQLRVTVVPLTAAARLCGGSGATAATIDTDRPAKTIVTRSRLYMSARVDPVARMGQELQNQHCERRLTAKPRI